MLSPMIASLPAPPLLEHWLLEQSIVPGVFLLVFAIVAAYIPWSRGTGGKAMLPAGLLAVAGIAIMVTGHLVETEREELLHRNREFVQIIMTSDFVAADDYLAPGVSVSVSGEYLARMDRDWMLSMIQTFEANLQITDSSFSYKAASVDGPGIGRTLFKARVQSATFGGPHPTTWEIAWRQDPEGRWQVSEFNWLTYLGQKPSTNWLGGLKTGHFN